MKILIFGGTGAMGNHLVNILSNTGNQVYVTTRQKYQNRMGVKYIQGDARDLLFLENLIQETFDCIVDFMIYTTEEFSQRYKNLLNKTKQYVFLSSARVYANSNTPIMEESPRLLDVTTDTDYLKTDEYALSKARQENLLYDSGFSNYSIIRPYITYSETRLQLGVFEKEVWLQRVLLGKTILFSKDIAEHKTTLTYGFNVAQGIAALLGNEKAYGEVFHITQDTALSWQSVWKVYKPIIEKYTQKEAKIEFTDFSTFTKIFSSSYQIKYDRLFDRTFDNSKINQFIDTTTFVHPEDGLTKCLENFIKNKVHFLHFSSGFQGRLDRYTKEFTSLSDISGIRNKIAYLVRRLGV